MTEHEWLTSEDPTAMLAYLEAMNSAVGVGVSPYPVPHTSDRKLRLFACACYRAHPGFEDWDRTGPSSYWCVEAGEAIADNLPLPLIDGAVPCDGVREAARIGLETLCHCVRVDTVDAARMSVASPMGRAFWSHVAYLQANLLRCIVGNPFRPVALPAGQRCHRCRGKGTVSPGAGAAVQRPETRKLCKRCGGRGHAPGPWLTSDVLLLAQAAYNDRLADGTLDPLTLAALADALGEAGCEEKQRQVVCVTCKGYGSYTVFQGPGATNPRHKECPACIGKGEKTLAEPHPLLAHLRSPDPHVRGCWALDLMLEKG